MCRLVIVMAALIGLLASTVGSAFAQDGFPETGFSNEVMSTYGLPEIQFKDDGNGLVNPPSELKEGYYLATVKQTEGLFVYIEFVQPPGGSFQNRDGRSIPHCRAMKSSLTAGSSPAGPFQVLAPTELLSST